MKVEVCVALTRRERERMRMMQEVLYGIRQAAAMACYGVTLIAAATAVVVVAGIDSPGADLVRLSEMAFACIGIVAVSAGAGRALKGERA